MAPDRPAACARTGQGGLLERAAAARELTRGCRLCPRRCGVDRTRGEVGFCGAGSELEIASSCVHGGEEPVLTGGFGVGNVFLARCVMSCVYCQNWAISSPGPAPRPDWRTTPEELALLLLRYQEAGCPCVGLVTPTHYAPHLLEALSIAAARGLRVPLIWNSSAYDSPKLLELLEGVVDIYLPDLRYMDGRTALELSSAPGYPEAARRALREMHRQVGLLETGPGGTAVSGMLVRLLVLPGGLSDTPDALRWIAAELGSEVAVSLMSQYHPCHLARERPPLHRRLLPAEYDEALEALHRLGFESGWVQDQVESPESWLPGQDGEGLEFPEDR